MKKYFLLLLPFFLIASAHAQAPLPAKKSETVDSLNQKVEAEKARQKELDKQAQLIETDLSGIKDNLVKTAGQVQKNEKTLQEIEAELATLKARKAELSSQLATDRQSLSGLIIALERIRRLPPETLLAKPGAPRETAQAATALSAILPELNKRAEELRLKLEDLQNTEIELARKQDEQKDFAERLKGEKDKMNTLLASRSKAFAQTQADLKKQQQAVATASREAADFAELIRKIEEKNRQLEKEKAAREAAQAARPSAGRKQPDERKLAATLPTLGNGQLPISGIVRVRYGESDEIGATSQGIKIEGRSGATVVAPLGGVVRYAGPFKAYGNIILLEHKNNYHSLIAGLGRIDTVVGQSVDSGEPVGSLVNGAGASPTLYYELRLNGQPINPAKKFTDLGT